jgi:hypothetical protein
MSDISDAADLLAAAREALLGELVPALPKDRRYAALMIANAMAIAAREQRLGFDADQSEAARLRNLHDDIGASFTRPADPIDTGLSALRTSTRDAIRDGRFDAPERWKTLVATLLHTAAERVAISNPKALRGEVADVAR